MNVKAERAVTRDDVFKALWSDPQYLALHKRKDDVGRMWRYAARYDAVAADSVGKQFQAACRRITRYEDRALKAAGV